MLLKLFFAWMSIKAALCGGRIENEGKKIRLERHKADITFISKMNSEIDESSGLAYNSSGKTLYTINDGKIDGFFEMDMQGRLLEKVKLPGLSTADAEALFLEKNRYLYIGDVGNNANSRREMRIMKYDVEHPELPAAVTSFRYADQTEYPPARRYRRYDCEAFWKNGNNFYLLSKNRGEKTVRLYRTGDGHRSTIAVPIQKIKFRLPVTDAAFIPESNSLAVLTYGMVYFFEVQEESLVPVMAVRIRKSKQCEAITYIEQNLLMYTNEEGELYELKTEK